MKRKIILFISSLFIFVMSALSQDNKSVKFEFKYQKGDRYRILSTVNEDVFVNRKKSHHSIIVNRVSAAITEVTADGQGIHNCSFMTTEDSVGSFSGTTFSYGEEYKSIFKRSKTGLYTISDEYFMPTVRDVPIFLDKEVAPGESWTAQGHEAHDLRKGFNIEKPFKVPFTAEYTYVGQDEKTGLYIIKVKYSMQMESPALNSFEYEEYPVTTQGFSDETIYWDNEKGAIDHYSENFRIFIETSLGNLFEFTGNAHAEVTEFERTNTTENLSTVKNKIEELGLENVSVSNGEKGLTIAIENIQFKPDSAILLESEKAKLVQIATILEAWPNNDILITGHTALAGTEKMRKLLSEQRAASVANYLIELNVRDKFHIFTQGLGATKPISSNATEEGKARNRRVEITIMDN